MAVTYDNVASMSSEGDADGLLSFNLTVNSVNNGGAIVVGIACSISPQTLITNVTVGGVSATRLGYRESQDSASGGISLWGIINNTTGSVTIAITGATNADYECGAISFTGVNQSTPFGTLVSQSGNTTSISVGVTDSVGGDMVVDAVSNGSAITSSSQTNRWLINLNGASGAGNGAQSTAPGASGTVTMSYVVSSDWNAILAVAIKQSIASSVSMPDGNSRRFFSNLMGL